MFVRFSRLMLRRISQHRESTVTWRRFCSYDETGKTSEDESSLKESALNNTDITHPKNYNLKNWHEIADLFMSDLSEEHLLLKKEIEHELDVMRRGNFYVPYKIIPFDWMILLTEKQSLYKRQRYLEYLTNRRLSHIKNTMKKNRKKRKAMFENTVEDKNVYSYYTMDRRKVISRWNSVKAMQSDMEVIVDLGFDGNLSTQGIIGVRVDLLVHLNNVHVQPLKIHVTSAVNNYKMKSVMNSSEENYALFYRDHFLDVFPHHESLVYLSPEGPPMNEFNPNSTYIIGGLDKGQDEYGQTLDFAIEQGLQCASFPINNYFMGPRIHNLEICNAFRIIQDMYLHNSWKEAFIKHLPHTYKLRQDVATQNDMIQREQYQSPFVSNQLVNILKGKSANM